MANCSNCADELKFSNKVIGGMGNLNDGNTICRKCFKEISKVDIKFANSLKKYSLDQFKQVLLDKGVKNDADPLTQTEDSQDEKKKPTGLQIIVSFITLALGVYLIYLSIKLFFLT